MEGKPSAIYTFEDFHLDPTRRLLLRGPSEDTVALTHKAFELLLLLVENGGRLVTKDELMAAVWPNRFVEDSNLTQTISVLRKTLGENPNQHRFIVTEPGKGYRFVAPVSHEVEHERTGGADQGSVGDSVERSRRSAVLGLGAAATLFLVLAGSYFLYKPAVAEVSTAPTGKVRAIAVLPFRHVDRDNGDPVLGIGMADAIITKLSHVRSVVVRQTTSVARYADSTPEALKVARELNVDAVLEGTIQKADGRIRVFARLFSVADGALLWAENFDEPDKDIFTLQDAISEKVTTSLSIELNPEERNNLKRRYTENLEAYQLYNKGRFFWNNRSSEDLRKSIAFYQQAIALDENYALAYSGMAESYVLLHLFSPNQDKEAFRKARETAEKALSLDENLVEARTALAMYKVQAEWDWEAGDREFRRAIAANPNYATAHQTYSEMLGFTGRIDESIRETEMAFQLDPLSLSTNTALAFPYMISGRFDTAIEKLRAVFEMDENFPMARFYLARCYAGKGLYKESVAEYEKAIQHSGGSTFFVSAMIYSMAKGGQKKEAQRKFAELLSLAEREPISTYVLARGYAAIGDNANALEKLERAFEERDGLMHVIRVDPNLDGLRNEPRFQEIIRKMNLVGRG